MSAGGTTPAPSLIDIDILGAMVLAIDEDGRISRCNEAACTALGYRPADIVGIPASSVIHRRPSGAYTFRCADGGTLRALASPAPDSGSDGTIVAAVPLPSALDSEHSARLNVLGDLAHHVVHELNQPLSVIRMAIGTAKRKLERDNDIDVPFLVSKLDRIDAQCLRAAAIAETMRVFVPRDRETIVPLEVNRAVENALSMAAPRFRKLNVGIESVQDRECRVMGNEMHIEPILLCVLGEVHDRIAQAATHRSQDVLVQTHVVGEERVEIVIEDTGGVPSGGKPDADASSPAAQGMKLSLAVALAAEMGGRLEYESSGNGLRYRLELPLANVGDAAT